MRVSGQSTAAPFKAHKECFSGDSAPYKVPDIESILSHYNSEHNIPEKFMNTVREMYSFVQHKQEA